MLGFGENYTREKFDEANEFAVREDKAYRNIGSLNGLLPNERQRIYDGLFDDSIKADKRVKELYGKSEKEATALNEEYDRLQKRAQEAILAIANFETEKLGMHKETIEASNGEK